MPPPLDELCAAYATVLQCIKRHLYLGAAQGVHNLRSVNRTLRTAVDSSVQRLMLRPKRQPILSEGLGARFEAVTSLVVNAFEGEAGQGHASFVAFLEQLQHEHALLAKLQHLKLTFDEQGASSNGAVGETLSRCTGLQHLDVELYTNADDSIFDVNFHMWTFEPQGPTPEQRAAALQRQIAAFAASPDFLAPPTWPQHDCLTNARLHPSDGQGLPCLLLQHVFRAASLAKLELCISCDVDLSVLTGLRNLSGLTCLEVGNNHPSSLTSPSSPHDIHLAMAELRRLRFLRLDTIIFAPYGEPISIPEAWSGMQALQELELEICCVDSAQLALCSQALTRLRLMDCTISGSLSSLMRLTNLVEVDLDCCLVADEVEVVNSQLAAAQEPEQQPLQLRALGGWPERLQCLEWHCDVACHALLPQLQQLALLRLNFAVLTPELCRSICELPQLVLLHLEDVVSVGDEFDRERGRQLRPCLPPSLKQIILSARDEHQACRSLQDLAQWTQIPASRTTVPAIACKSGCWCDKQVEQGWALRKDVSVGWLKAVLMSEGLRGISFVLPDDDAVHLLLAALASLASGCVVRPGFQLGTEFVFIKPATLPPDNGKPGPPYHPDLVLGPKVTPAAFRQLFLSPHHPSSTLAIKGDLPSSSQEQAPAGLGLTLRHAHVCALAGVVNTVLQRLELWDCSALTDYDVMLLARATPVLESLLLAKAVQLTDTGLAVLAACPKLAKLQLSDASSVTAAGVMLVRGALPCLTALRLQGVAAALVADLMHLLYGQQQFPAARQWGMSTPDGLTVELLVQNCRAAPEPGHCN